MSEGRELPEGWEVVPVGPSLGLDGLLNDGDWIETKDQDPSGEVRLIQLADIGIGAFRDRSDRFLTLERARELGCTFLREGDVLVARLADPLGRACLLPPQAQACITAVDVCIVRPGKDGPDPRWLVTVFNSPQWLALVESRASGTTRKRISRSNLAETELLLPPLAEQRRIVAKIEALQARSRKAREALASVPPLLDHLRQSILSSAFRGHLTADWRAERDPQRSAMAAPPPSSPDVPWPLPAGWRWSTLGAEAVLKGGLQRGKKRAAGETLCRVPYLRVANVQRGFLDLREMLEIEATPAEVAGLTLRPGDILFNEGGDRDKLGRGWVWAGEVPVCIHQNHVFRARLHDAAAAPRLVSWYANAFGRDHFEAGGVQTTNLASISLATLAALPIPIVPSAETLVLSERISGALQAVERSHGALVEGLADLASLDASILAKAFRGDLVPQDPNDEPASVLLTRIRAEREAITNAPPADARPRRRSRS